MAMLIEKNDVVIDFGAHVGLASIEFALAGAKVYAFEPNPENFAELRRNTANYPRISIYEKAVSDKSGYARLYFEPTGPTKYFEGATIVEGKSNIGYDHHFEVETISATEIFDMIKGPIAVIKMDIEGAEYRALDALINSDQMDRVGKVYVECHVNRMPSLAKAKEHTLALAKAAGVFHKLDFTWP